MDVSEERIWVKRKINLKKLTGMQHGKINKRSRDKENRMKGRAVV